MKRLLSIVGIAGLLLSAGCDLLGGDDSSTPRRGTIEVTTVAEDGTPQEGVDVVFQDAEGSVLSRGVTGANGTLDGEVPSGGMVTVVFLDEWGDTTINTVTGVKHGDHLVFGFESGDEDTVGLPVATPTLHLPAFPGATEYAIDLGCSESWTTPEDGLDVETELYAACVGAGNTYDAIATAMDAESLPLAFSVTPNLSVTAPAASLAAWSTAWLDYSVALTNGPVDAEVSLFVSLIEEGGEYDGGGFIDATTVLTNGAGIVTAQIPPAFGTATQRTVLVGDLFGESVRYIFTRENGVTPMKSYDLGLELLPEISNVAIAGSVLTWTEGGDLSSTDGGFLSASWETGEYTEWSVTVPPGTAAFRFPTLPDDLAPVGDAVDLSVGFYDVSTISGYDALRNVGFGLPVDGEYEMRGSQANTSLGDDDDA